MNTIERCDGRSMSSSLRIRVIRVRVASSCNNRLAFARFVVDTSKLVVVFWTSQLHTTHDVYHNEDNHQRRGVVVVVVWDTVSSHAWIYRRSPSVVVVVVVKRKRKQLW